MKQTLINIYKVWKHEFKIVYADLGVTIFFLLLPFAYPIVYSAIYNPELVRDVPVVVVDDCRNALSRKYARHLDATQYVKVSNYISDMQEAHRAMAEKECYAVIHFPGDFSEKVERGETATIEVFCDMSLLLRYKSVVIAVTSVAEDTGAEIQAKRIAELTETAPQTNIPIPYKLEPIGNVSQGLASAILPGILVLILQQSIILAICFLGATARERAKQNNGIDPMALRTSILSTIIGKALCYFTIMIVPSIFVLHFVPIFFSFPMNGNVLEEIIFFTPYLLAVIFFGMTIQVAIPDRESTFLVFVFTSIAFIFLSGISWPRYAMSEFWQLLGDCIPSTWGVTGYIGLNTSGADLSQQSTPYLMLWIHTATYFLLACLLNRKKEHIY